MCVTWNESLGFVLAFRFFCWVHPSGSYHVTPLLSLLLNMEGTSIGRYLMSRSSCLLFLCLFSPSYSFNTRFSSRTGAHHPCLNHRECSNRQWQYFGPGGDRLSPSGFCWGSAPSLLSDQYSILSLITFVCMWRDLCYVPVLYLRGSARDPN